MYNLWTWYVVMDVISGSIGKYYATMHACMYLYVYTSIQLLRNCVGLTADPLDEWLCENCSS